MWLNKLLGQQGYLDPEVIIRPLTGQIDDLYAEIIDNTKLGFRVLVTTLTKRMSEDLTKYFKEMGLKVNYLHSGITTIERMKIIRNLRKGEQDVLIGINLLREGLDIPEVALVAILDADKEGFLRSETSLIQTIGRAARNSESKVIMYADNITKSMSKAINETNRRRKLQMEYNRVHGIIPTTIMKDIREILEISKVAETGASYDSLEAAVEANEGNIEKTIEKYNKEMLQAAKDLQFERAGRDQRCNSFT